VDAVAFLGTRGSVVLVGDKEFCPFDDVGFEVCSHVFCFLYNGNW